MLITVLFFVKFDNKLKKPILTSTLFTALCGLAIKAFYFQKLAYQVERYNSTKTLYSSFHFIDQIFYFKKWLLTFLNFNQANLIFLLIPLSLLSYTFYRHKADKNNLYFISLIFAVFFSIFFIDFLFDKRWIVSARYSLISCLFISFLYGWALSRNKLFITIIFSSLLLFFQCVPKGQVLRSLNTLDNHDLKTIRHFDTTLLKDETLFLVNNLTIKEIIFLQFQINKLNNKNHCKRIDLDDKTLENIYLIKKDFWNEEYRNKFTNVIDLNFLDQEINIKTKL